MALDRIEMTVAGLECPLCARALERRLSEIEGSRALEIDLARGEVRFELVEGHRLNDEKLRDLVEAAGFHVKEITRAPWIDDSA